MKKPEYINGPSIPTVIMVWFVLGVVGCSLVREPAWMDAPTEDTQRKSPSMKSPSVSPLLTPRMPPMVVNPMERVIRKEAEKRRRVAAHTNFRSRFNVQSSTVQPIPVPPSPIPSGMKVTVDSYEQAKRKALIKFQAAQRQQALNSTPPLPVPPGMNTSVRAPTPVRGQSMMRAPAPNIPVNFVWVHSPSPGVKTYSVDFGSHTNYLTNQLVTGYVTNATVLIPSDGQRRYFGMRASNGANYSERTPLVMFPPDIIYTGNVESGPLAGPYTNFVQLFRFTNSPPEPEQGFKVSITTEKNYAP